MAWLTAVVGAVVMSSIVLAADATIGIRSGRAQVALQTIAACCCVALVPLLLARVRRTRRLKDWRLALGITMLGLAGPVVQYGIEMFAPWTANAYGVWAPQGVRLAGAALLVVAAFTDPARRARRGRVLRSAAFTGIGLGLFLLLGWFVRAALPTAVSVDGTGTHAPAAPVSHSLLVTVLGGTAALLLVAGLEFAAQSRTGHDPVVRALGPACMLATVAELHQVVLPSLYTDWVSAGDLLWVQACLVLVVAAGGEIERYYAMQSRRAAVQARRSFARELHDGVIQELTFLRAAATTLDHVERRTVVEACDRALADARGALLTLNHRTDLSLAAVLGPFASELCQRYAVGVELRLDEEAPAPPDATHDIVRIVGEAVANAVRHGHASVIVIGLMTLDGGGVRLTVCDDGDGFHVRDEPTRPTSQGGYGMTSMRERAQSIGATFELRSRPGHGTEVAVTWSA